MEPQEQQEPQNDNPNIKQWSKCLIFMKYFK